MSKILTANLQGLIPGSSMSSKASKSAMSFTAVYSEYRHKIYSYVFYRVGNDNDIAEDIVSDVFVKAYKAFDSYDNKYAVSTWLYTIARNTLIDHYRKSKEIIDIDDLQVEDKTDPLYLILDKDISLDELNNAIDDLPEKQSQYIKQQFFDGYTAKEIADLEGVSHDSVRKQVSRGLALMRDKLLIFVAVILGFNI